MPGRRGTAQPAATGAGGFGRRQGPLPGPPGAHAIWELHQAEVNIARLERSLARSRTSRAERRMWRSELVDWGSNHATASRAVEGLSAPELAGIEDEERRLGERLTGLWRQHETHQRWAAEHREASRRLDHLAGDIDALDARLAHHRLAQDRARVVGTPGVVLGRGLGIDL